LEVEIITSQLAFTQNYLVTLIKRTHNTVHIAGRVRWYVNCAPKRRGSFRSSVSFGQERSPKYAPTTCT